VHGVAGALGNDVAQYGAAEEREVADEVERSTRLSARAMDPWSTEASSSVMPNSRQSAAKPRRRRPIQSLP
jgi:hypothetical protein